MDTPFFRVFFLCYKQVTTKKIPANLNDCRDFFIAIVYWQASRLQSTISVSSRWSLPR